MDKPALNDVRHLTNRAIDHCIAKFVLGWDNERPEAADIALGMAWMRQEGERWVWSGWLSVDPYMRSEWTKDGLVEYQIPSVLCGTKRFAPTTDPESFKVVSDFVKTWPDHVKERFLVILDTMMKIKYKVNDPAWWTFYMRYPEFCRAAITTVIGIQEGANE